MAEQATIKIRDKQWLVSIANTPWEMVQGLGGIPELSPETGVLFDLGCEQIIQVTTTPMLFPLDIAFLSDELTVTEVHCNVEPGHVFTSALLARYFLEVNAGELDTICADDEASLDFLISEELPVIPEWVPALTSLAGLVGVGIFTVGLTKTSIRHLLTDTESTREAPR